MRRVIVMMIVLIMLVLVVAQADDDDPTVPCTVKCGAKCFLKKKKSHLLYLLCFDLCMLKCIAFPSDILYNCIFSCAQSMPTNFFSGIYIKETIDFILFQSFFSHLFFKFIIELGFRTFFIRRWIRDVLESENKYFSSINFFIKICYTFIYNLSLLILFCKSII
jgi:hypothetical protein